MFQVLLVDDEKIVLNTMKEIVPWETYHSQLCGVCSSAMEALEIIRRERPDIVVTDIRMPVMNGIDLIRHVRSEGFDPEFIILSGYDEFEFAKSAMQEGVKHYLLKPCGEEEIGSALLRAQEDLAVRRQSAAYSVRVEKSLLEQFLMLTLQGGEALPIDSALHAGEGLYWAVFSCPGRPVNARSMFAALQSAGFSGAELIKPAFCIGNAVGGVYLYRGQQPGLAELTLLQRSLAGPLGGFPSLLAAGPLDISSVRRRLRDVCGEYTAFTALTEEGSADYRTVRSVSVELLDGVLSWLEAALLHHDPQEALSLLQRTYGREISQQVCTRLLVRSLLNGTLAAREMAAALQSLDEGQYQPLEKLLAPRQQTEQTDEDFIDYILRYLEERLDDERLSLKWVASKLVFRNEDYVGKAFARRTGRTFISYLNTLRVERAKKLLSAPGEKRLSEVAERVGLGNNPRYFGRLFKKYTGYTPGEYRDLNK